MAASTWAELMVFYTSTLVQPKQGYQKTNRGKAEPSHTEQKKLGYQKTNKGKSNQSHSSAQTGVPEDQQRYVKLSPIVQPKSGTRKPIKVKVNQPNSATQTGVPEEQSIAQLRNR